MKPSKGVKDLTGMTYGRLTVLKFDHCENWRSFWLCVCECGNKSVKKGKYLINGDTRSCGCLEKEACSLNGKKMNQASSATKKKKGLWIDGKKHPLTTILKGMVQRCHNANSKIYRWYGGKGVSVCDEWRLDTASFVQWGIKNGYKQGLQIDRIDSDGNYCPENCRFITRSENLIRSHESLRKNNLRRKLDEEKENKNSKE